MFSKAQSGQLEKLPEKNTKRSRSYSDSRLFRAGAQTDLLVLVEALQYDHLEKNKRKLIGNYRVTPMVPFIKLMREEIASGIEKQPDLNVMRMSYGNRKIQTDEAGWKIHISVAPEDIEKAWNLVYPILIENKVNNFKVISESILNKWRSNPAPEVLAKFINKQITIYQFKDGHLSKEDWERIIKLIEETLIENEIKGSIFPEVDNPIAGSTYFSCRNDKHPDTKEYMDTDVTLVQAKHHPERKVYNLVDEKDELAELRPFEVGVTLGQ